jgi:hypothetical protein
MKIAYTALHYGSPYLEWAIRSVIDHVDQYYVLYSADGSHGTKAQLQLPESDSREALQKIAHDVAGDKLIWIDGNWRHEGEQRDSIHTICPNADVVLVLDYDEIWNDPGAAIRMAIQGNKRNYRLPMVHFWRSFHRAVLHDPAYPTRIICPQVIIGDDTLQVAPIAHMGYAIPSWLVRYKMAIHGHKAELRGDVDWFRDRWLCDADIDCHPVGSEFWNPELIRPDDYLPDFMQDHPYWNMRLIP